MEEKDVKKYKEAIEGAMGDIGLLKKYREALESAYEKSAKLFEEFEERIKDKRGEDVFKELFKFVEEKKLTPAEATWLSVLLFTRKQKEIF